MTYDQRKHMETVIVEEKGSVYHKGRIISHPDHLPSAADLAKGDKAREAAVREQLLAHRAALDSQLDQLGSDERAGVGSEEEPGDDLSSLSLTALRQKAKEAGVKGYSTMDQDSLIAALEEK